MTDDFRTAPDPPTWDAYNAACAAIEKHRQRADQAEAALQELRDRMTALADMWETPADRPAIHPAAIAVRAVLAGDMDPREWMARIAGLKEMAS